MQRKLKKIFSKNSIANEEPATTLEGNLTDLLKVEQNQLDYIDSLLEDNLNLTYENIGALRSVTQSKSNYEFNSEESNNDYIGQRSKSVPIDLNNEIKDNVSSSYKSTYIMIRDRNDKIQQSNSTNTNSVTRNLSNAKIMPNLSQNRTNPVMTNVSQNSQNYSATADVRRYQQLENNTRPRQSINVMNVNADNHMIVSNSRNEHFSSYITPHQETPTQRQQFSPPLLENPFSDMYSIESLSSLPRGSDIQTQEFAVEIHPPSYDDIIGFNPPQYIEH
ncbi:hypothetical protein HDU92_001997 [Lobulomyces angularis]|nr:hypothetical protein HDU92_001997 [Lobulomyces angularis]